VYKKTRAKVDYKKLSLFAFHIYFSELFFLSLLFEPFWLVAMKSKSTSDASFA